MKKQLFTIIAACLLMAGTALAQAPEKFNYQGIARNGTGQPLPAQPISLRISILDGSSSGTVLYSETHAATTNAFGLYNVAIGSGTVVSGAMSGISWGSSSKFIKVEMDPAGGGSYTTLGNSELLSVPYALQSASSSNIAGGANNLIKFTGSNTGGNSIISEVNGATNTLNIGAPAIPTITSFYGPATQAYNQFYEGGAARGYFGSYSGANDDVDFGTSGGSTGKLHLTISATPKLTIMNNGDVGIGTTAPTTTLEVKGTRTTAQANLIVTETTSSPFPGITLNNSASATTGVNLYGRGGQGLNVVNLAATTYVPVYASAFTVSSDIRTKKEINYLKELDFEKYLSQIRNISSATYRYNWEDAQSRPVAHVGFISQSLPSAVQMEIDADPSKEGEKYIGYNLSDMAGLTVIGLKALDHKLTQHEKTIQSQAIHIQKLEERLAALESK